MVRPMRSTSAVACWKFGKQLAAYSTASFATVVLAERVDAEIVPYVPPGGPIVLHNSNGSSPYDSINLDINGDAQFDFQLDGYLGFVIRGIFANPPLRTVLLSEPYFAAVVPTGETIGPLSSEWGTFALLDNFIGTRGYLGLQFDIPGGSPHFGYLDINIDPDESELTIYGGAYESLANTAIEAAQVPEPSGLGLLAMGAAGLAAWRLKKTRKESA